MDKNAVDGGEMKFPSEVLAPTSNVEEQGADLPVESNLLGVNASLNLTDNLVHHPEMTESKCEDDITSLVHDTVESALLACDAVTLTPVVHNTLEPTTACNISTGKSDTVEETDCSQSIHGHSSGTSLPEESESATDIVDKTNSHITAGEQTDAHQVQSDNSTSINESCSLHGQDSSVHSIGSRDNVQKPLEENKNNFTQDQSHHETVDVVSAEDAHGPHLENSVNCNTSKLSALTTSESETQITVSHLKAAAAEPATAHHDHESVYYIKWIMFGTRNVPIITQNENGPCPLLAIMNVLLLKEKVKLAPMLQMITSEQLMTYLGECIFENMPQNLSETTQANYEQNMQDAMSVMYKLQTGLDVNVKFTGVGDFEYTPELIVFDLLGISLYHGWLVDPQDSDTVNAINQCSYNQLVEKIICLRQSEEEENVRQALIAEQFLDRTASQLTYHGLCELSSLIKEKELCVFFRNNHFNTLYKHNNELFLLVTDQGFLTEGNVVWETLSNVDGDCHFTDATFRTYTKPAPSTTPIPDPGVPVGSPEQIDHDYQVALFLQEEDASLQNQAWGSALPPEQSSYTDTDHEYAMRLQEEENRQITGEYERTPGTAASDTVSQHGQGNFPSHALPTDGQRRRVERGERKEKEDKSSGKPPTENITQNMNYVDPTTIPRGLRKKCTCEPNNVFVKQMHELQSARQPV